MLKDFYQFLECEIKPKANLLDSSTHALKIALKKMRVLNSYGIDVPKELGGLALVAKYVLRRDGIFFNG